MKEMKRHEFRKFCEDLAWFVKDADQTETEIIIFLAKRIDSRFDEIIFRLYLEEIRAEKD